MPKRNDSKGREEVMMTFEDIHAPLFLEVAVEPEELRKAQVTLRVRYILALEGKPDPDLVSDVQAFMEEGARCEKVLVVDRRNEWAKEGQLIQKAREVLKGLLPRGNQKSKKVLTIYAIAMPFVTLGLLTIVALLWPWELEVGWVFVLTAFLVLVLGGEVPWILRWRKRLQVGKELEDSLRVAEEKFRQRFGMECPTQKLLED